MAVSKRTIEGVDIEVDLAVAAGRLLRVADARSQ